MATTFDDVTATLDKTSYVAGETIRITIAGQAESVESTNQQVTIGPVDLPVVASNGSPGVIHLPATPVTLTSDVTTFLDVLIDPARAIVDNGTPPRTWAISADRKSITAVA